MYGILLGMEERRPLGQRAQASAGSICRWGLGWRGHVRRFRQDGLEGASLAVAEFQPDIGRLSPKSGDRKEEAGGVKTEPQLKCRKRRQGGSRQTWLSLQA